MRVVGYVRVSTTDQAETGISLEAQRARITAWAAAHGAELLVIYEDAGISGMKSDREGLLAAVERACREKAALVSYSLSRLSRSTRAMLELADRLSKAGADLVSLSERIDTTSAAGRLFFRVMAALGEFERDQIAERVREALQHKRALGERVGSIPYGSRLAADGIHLEENFAEREMVEEIHRLRGAGRTFRWITGHLDREHRDRARGRSWRRATVWKIAQGVVA